MTIVAAYFGGWKSPPEAAVTWYTPSPWTTNAEQDRYFSDYTERYPTYGAVDEDDQSIIDYHLELADAAGIDVFAVCWYRDAYLSYALDRIKASQSSAEIKYCILWANHYESMSPTESDKEWFFEGVRLMAVHSQNDRCWTKDGRPVMVFFSSTHFDDVIRTALGQSAGYTPTQNETNALMDDVFNIAANVFDGDLTGGISGATVSAASGDGPYIVMMTPSSRYAQANHVDCVTAYNVRTGTFPDATRYAHSFTELQSACLQKTVANVTTCNQYGSTFWPVLMAGWDARPWGGTDGDAEADNCTPTDAEFRAACRAARIQAQDPVCDTTVFLYAWNEFGEGGYVQPTVGSGTARLNALSILKD